MWETWVRSLGREDPLEKEMATHSSILAWRILWMEEPGRLQSMGSQRVGHDWATSLHFFTSCNGGGAIGGSHCSCSCNCFSSLDPLLWEQPIWPLWGNYSRVTLLPWEPGLAWYAKWGPDFGPIAFWSGPATCIATHYQPRSSSVSSFRFWFTPPSQRGLL